jgi:C4-type Zn-finger protein
MLGKAYSPENTKSYILEIPQFPKKVIIMSTLCEECGYKSNEETVVEL